MIASMTGYGRAEGDLRGERLIVEMKSVNHRNLELALRYPPALSPFEMDIRKRLGECFCRGRIEVAVRLERDGAVAGDETRLTWNVPLARQYHDVFTSMKTTLGLSGEVSLAMMAGMRDIIVPQNGDAEVLPVAWDELAGIFDEAAAALAAMRVAEGEILKQDILERIGVMDNHLGGIVARAPEVVAEYRRRLNERISEMLGSVAIDEARLCQEVAIMAEKSDITEEVVRLRSHIAQFLELMASGEAVGRKVDFLLQEMNREVNTIGSKSADVDIARRVIDIKSELAKLREQVQNLE